jgi:hypothetical protein
MNKKRGRPMVETPRKHRYCIYLTDDENKVVEECCKHQQDGLSRAELIRDIFLSWCNTINSLKHKVNRLRG